MYHDICERIKENRKRLGLTQTELGKLLGVQKSAIQKYESGSNQYKLETIVRLAEVFEISVSALIGEKQEESDVRKVIFELYGAKGLGLWEVFTTLNESGKLKVLTYAQDIMPNYSFNMNITKNGEGI